MGFKKASVIGQTSVFVKPAVAPPPPPGAPPPPPGPPPSQVAPSIHKQANQASPQTQRSKAKPIRPALPSQMSDAQSRPVTGPSAGPPPPPPPPPLPQPGQPQQDIETEPEQSTTSLESSDGGLLAALRNAKLKKVSKVFLPKLFLN